MMICLAESLIEKGFDPKDQFNKYKLWLLSGYATPDSNKAYGIGQQTMKALSSKYTPFKGVVYSDEKAGGNGSLMRCVPIGLKYIGDYSKIKKYSIEASYVTHPNLIASWSCVILNAMISLIIESTPKNTLLHKTLTLYPDCPTKFQEMLKSDFTKIQVEQLEVSGYSLNTLNIALWSFLTTDSYSHCIERVISLGNDTDTFAAVAGAIAGCYYGYNNIPTEWRDGVLNIKHIENLATKLFV
jgi:ADP-ribosyl-[dinitrogen reductase] hydrolase